MITTKMETVTPEKAKGWLERNKNPRLIKERKVLHFVRHLENRTFELTHQGIALDENGYLVDGQHRLEAIVRTGQTVDMFVTRGLGIKALMVVDRGDRRGNDVVLGCDKRIAQIVSFATRIIMRSGIQLESDLMKVKRALEEDAELLLSSYARSQRRLTSAPIKLGAVLNMKNDPDWVCAQWKAFNTGDFPNQSLPIQWLYRRVMGDRIITPSGVFVYAFKAFNKANKEMETMTVKNIELNLDEIRKVLRSMAGFKPEK